MPWEVHKMKTKKIGILKNEQVTRKIELLSASFFLGWFFTILTRKFLTVSNIVNVLQQSTINGCVALGMTLVIITEASIYPSDLSWR